MPSNLYGDQLTSHRNGHGADIASQRADDLDRVALQVIAELSSSQTVTALDLACGLGGQAQRMRQAGARVAAVDSKDFSTHFPATADVQFVQADLRQLPAQLPFAPYDIVVCQRAIHYLTYSEAVAALHALIPLLNPNAHLFLSASGLRSNLGLKYPAASLPVAERFCALDSVMANKHQIQAPVCLYTPDELEQLLHEAGFHTYKSWSSQFGNVKACATIA